MGAGTAGPGPAVTAKRIWQAPDERQKTEPSALGPVTDKFIGRTGLPPSRRHNWARRGRLYRGIGRNIRERTDGLDHDDPLKPLLLKALEDLKQRTDE
ncbi:MAG: hypothetical protein LBP22_01025 [Deltaproteobacteria bacterium]|nr:hypothetical protein [Deltaproteobacteria bacterium]